MDSINTIGTSIIHLWSTDEHLNEDSWRGSAEHIGGGNMLSSKNIKEINEWLQLKLTKISDD